MKILLGYATKSGTTKKCAQKISSLINGQVKTFDLTSKPPIIDDFDIVVLGTYVRYGKINKRLINYVKVNKKHLLNKPLFIFVCSLSQNSTVKVLSNSLPSSVLDHIKLAKSLGGELKVQDQNGVDKIVAKITSKIISKTSLPPTILEEELKRFCDEINSVINSEK